MYPTASVLKAIRPYVRDICPDVLPCNHRSVV
uniref:Uncharacterized protein n=1 Tax=Arundo donax TaxID=35708 RepID=A0A0A9G3K4_ARUDO